MFRIQGCFIDVLCSSVSTNRSRLAVPTSSTAPRAGAHFSRMVGDRLQRQILGDEMEVESIGHFKSEEHFVRLCLRMEE